MRRQRLPEIYIYLGLRTFTCLYLEEPDRCVDGNAQWSTGLFEFLHSEFGEGYALSGANLLVDTACISICQENLRQKELTHGCPLRLHTQQARRLAACS